jgi:multidrug efflux pump subunit AcrA (membrane-fusion protein)
VLGAVGVATWQRVTRQRPIDVETATVSARAAGAQAAVLNASGYVVARRRATVSSKITGKVIEVHVEEGMAVTEGACRWVVPGYQGGQAADSRGAAGAVRPQRSVL